MWKCCQVDGILFLDSLKSRFKYCVLHWLVVWANGFISLHAGLMKFLYWMICVDPLNKTLWLINSQTTNALLWRTDRCVLVWVLPEMDLRQGPSASDLNREVKDPGRLHFQISGKLRVSYQGGKVAGVVLYQLLSIIGWGLEGVGGWLNLLAFPFCYSSKQTRLWHYWKSSGKK